MPEKQAIQPIPSESAPTTNPDTVDAMSNTKKGDKNPPELAGGWLKNDATGWRFALPERENLPHMLITLFACQLCKVSLLLIFVKDEMRNKLLLSFF